MENHVYHPFFHPISRFKKMVRWLSFGLVLAMLTIPQTPLHACGGTPPPSCGRSIFLAKFAPAVVVFPFGGGPINVPIGVLPFVTWNNTGAPAAPVCPIPTGATLSLTLTCIPSGTVIGPLFFPVPVPTVPGPQPVGGPVNFVIPAGVFPPGTPPQACLVVGAYSVTFSDGVTLVGPGDTEVCLVDPTPLDVTKPRLEMEYLSPDNSNFKTCRRGDQAVFHFLIANNDPFQSVELDLTSTGRQASILPEGYDPSNAYGAGVYSISQPKEGTDTYAAEFADKLQPGELMPEPDPHAVDPQLLTRSIILGPCEATIIGIAMRSYGMCANGSCNERLVKVEGKFSDGDPALACASTLYLVGDAPAKSVLCEVADNIKVGDDGDAIWSPGQFSDQNGPLPHAQTFAAGNQPPNAEVGTRTVGSNFPDLLFASSASDYTRLDREPTIMEYSVTYTSGKCGKGTNNVILQGINDPSFPSFAAPVISFEGSQAPLEIRFDLPNKHMSIFLQGDILFQGPIEEFLNNPPGQFCVDYKMCRTMKKRSSLNDKTIFSVPSAWAELFYLPDPDPDCDVLGIYNNDNLPASWDAKVDGNGIYLPDDSGVEFLKFCYDGLDALPLVPETTIAYINISCPGALNNEVKVPVAIRVKKDFSDQLEDLLPENQSFVLHDARPNPFNWSTTIPYSLKENATMNLRIYNHLGQEVRRFVDAEKQGIGDYNFEWDGRDSEGRDMAAGVYVIHLEGNGKVSTSKVVLVR